MKAEHLELSKVKKAELFDFMKRTRNKEEYRRASAIKQKLEGLPYRTIARNLDVNYRNVYNWIKEHKEYGLDGIRSKRNRSYLVNVSANYKNTFKHLFSHTSLSSDVVNKLECLCISMEIVFVDAHELCYP